MQRTKEDIYALIKKGETFHLECKKAQGGLPGSLWESYSAFCNTDGGVILLGVRDEDGVFTVEGVGDELSIVKSFWDTIHNRERISTCVLAEKDVRIVSCDGKKVVAIDVPRAECRVRPVYVGTNAFEGTYRRNGEGDYKCTVDSVESMIRDRCVETADSCVMERLSPDDLNADTIRRYRRRFARCKPTSTWNELSDEAFLRNIGALGRDEKDVLRPTLAGLVCFGDFVAIATHVPNYFVDYREKLTGETRWNDRVCAHDGTWSGNIFALVEIGERSGHGLSNLLGVWKKSAFPSPSISESYDPDRTTVVLKLDEERLAKPTEPKLGQNNKGRVKSRVESRQEVDNEATQGSVKGSVKSSVESSVKELASLDGLPASARQVYKALCIDQGMTYVALMSKTGLSNRTITVATATLIKRGMLRRVGPKKGGHWEIVKPQPETGGNGS